MNEDEFQARRGARLNPNQPLGEGNIYPTPDQQPNLDPIEDIFKTPLPKSNVTTEHAKALHLEGKFFHPETNQPLYGAPRDFYQWKARESIDNATSWSGVGSGVINIFKYLDAFSQVAAPVMYPFVEPIRNVFKHGIWQNEEEMKEAGEAFQRNAKWSENTSDALHNLFTGQITENQAVEQISGEFEDRSLDEQLLLSIADPTQVGKVKLAAIGGKTLLAGLPFAIGRTSNKLKNFAKDPALNLRLNKWDSVLDNAPKPSPKEFIQNIRLGFEEKMIDKFAYANKVTNRLQREWREMFGDIKMPDEMHIEMQLGLFNGLGSAVRLKITDTLRKVDKNLNGIPGEFVSDFLNLKHLEAVHDAHPKRALPAGFNVKEDIGKAINKMADELTNQFGAGRMASVIDSARLIRDEYKRILQEFMDEDMVDRELGEKLMTMYPWYNPIAYSDDLAIVMSGGKAEASKVLRYLSDKGNVENLDVLPPLSIFPQMISRLEFMLARNRINRNFVHALEMSGEKITEIKGKSVPVAVQKIFDDVESAWKEEKIFRQQQLDLSKINKPIIHYLGEGGKLKVFEVPIEAFQSLEMMNSLSGVSSGAVKFVSRLQGVFKTAYTSGSPSFIVRQLVNDMITVAMLEKALPHRMAAAMYHSIRNIFKEDPMMRELVLRGGDVTGYHGQDWQKVLDDMMGPAKDLNQSVLNVDKSIYNRLFNPLSWLENLKRISHNLEMAPRAAVFNTNLGAGETAEYAAWRARNATVDFQKSGIWGRILNHVFMFANVATQGALLIPRALANPRTRKAAMIGTSGYGFFSALSYLQNRTDPNYWNMDFSERAKVGFMLGSNERHTSGARIGEKKPHFFAISPLSRELAIVSAPITYLLEHLEQALPEAMQAEGSVPPRKEDFGVVVYNAYNAMNAILGVSVNSLWGGLQSLAPTEAFRVGLEIGFNHDAYFDRPIVPPGYENLPEEEQFDDYTSEMAKRVGPYIPGLNPFQIDHLIKTGEFEELVLIADTLIRKFVMEEDVVADSYYQELENLLDHIEPNQMRTARRRFLSEFSKEMQDRIITIERQKPETFPERIPVASKMIDGFLRRKGGALHERGIIAAEDLTNMSAEQTREVSRGIGQFWGEFGTKYMQEAETGLLAYIENPYRIDGVEIVSPQEFVAQEKILNSMFHAKLMELKRDFPKAAQLQDKQTWLDWQNEVFSVGKQLDDSRSVAEINAALLRSIPLFDYVEGEEITIDPDNNITSKNWRKYFEYRDEVEKEIVKNFGQEGLEEAEEVLTASLTTMQRKRREDYDFIRPYWDVANYIIDFHESEGDTEIREEYERYERLEGEAAIHYINQQVIVTDEYGTEYKQGTLLNHIVNTQIPNARRDLLTGLLFYENDKWIHMENLSDAVISEQKSHALVGERGWVEPLLRERKINAAEMEKTIIFWGIREKIIDPNDFGLNAAWDYNRQAILDQQRQLFDQMEQMNIQR